jgi:hypothetical protein
MGLGSLLEILGCCDGSEVDGEKGASAFGVWAGGMMSIWLLDGLATLPCLASSDCSVLVCWWCSRVFRRMPPRDGQRDAGVEIEIEYFHFYCHCYSQRAESGEWRD